MVDTILDYLRTPLFTLSGEPVTTLTLLAAIAIVSAARIIASIVGRSLERLLESQGLDRGLRHAANKITRYVILIVGVLVASGTLGVDTSAIMAGGAVLLVGRQRTVQRQNVDAGTGGNPHVVESAVDFRGAG